MKRLAVISTTPMFRYRTKGEFKLHYYNPGELFDAVDIYTLVDDDLSDAEAQLLVGRAHLRVFPVGRLTPWRVPDKLGTVRRRLLSAMLEHTPDVLRAYDPHVAGWLATSVARALGRPAVISLHGDYDRDIRFHCWQTRQWGRFLFYQLSRRWLERPCLTAATKVICAYQFPVAYARNMGVPEERIEVIYNRVDLERFRPRERTQNDPRQPLTVISVGRLIPEKNQECLIEAIRDLNVRLVLIGDGVMYNKWRKMVEDSGLAARVVFHRSVPHQEIHRYYADADIYATAIKYGGISIPVLEAMAAGLPLVVPKPHFEQEPEVVGGLAMVVENTPAGFRAAIKRLMSDPELRDSLGRRGRECALQYDGRIMEAKEVALYRGLVKGQPRVPSGMIVPKQVRP